MAESSAWFIHSLCSALFPGHHWGPQGPQGRSGTRSGTAEDPGGTPPSWKGRSAGHRVWIATQAELKRLLRRFLCWNQDGCKCIGFGFVLSKLQNLSWTTARNITASFQHGKAKQWGNFSVVSINIKHHACGYHSWNGKYWLPFMTEEIVLFSPQYILNNLADLKFKKKKKRYKLVQPRFQSCVQHFT